MKTDYPGYTFQFAFHTILINIANRNTERINMINNEEQSNEFQKICK